MINSQLPLIRQARKELDLWLDTQLADFLGTTTRTIRRHPEAMGMVTVDGHARIIRALHPKNPVLAEQIAKSIGTSCAAMGLHAPPGVTAQPPAATGKPPATQDHATLVVCAAADALNLVPRAVRPALATIFAQARSMGVDLDSLAKLLADGEPKAKKG